MRVSRRVLALSFLFFSMLTMLGLGIWTTSLYSNLNQRLEKDWFLPPVEFYYPTLKIDAFSFSGSTDAKSKLLDLNYRERPQPQPLHARDFSSIPRQICSDELSSFRIILIEDCLRFKDQGGELYTLAWNESGIAEIFRGPELRKITVVFLEPRLIGEVRQGQPFKIRSLTLPEVPLLCLQAVTAIEDNQFLQHKGVSPSGIFRAVVRNLLAGKFAQGGSTITQQLVKNYFLSHEKTIKRKLNEQILAILLETKLTKDQILEKYLNVIYMGQDGPFQIVGLGAAAQHYFGKTISDLNLSECSLLAAVINSPGRFSPFNQTENAKSRRLLVLNRMREMDFISEDQVAAASTVGLPLETMSSQDPSAPYFLEATYAELVELGLDETTGFKVMTSLNPLSQIATEKAILQMLPEVEKRAKKGSKPLEAASVTVDLTTNQIIALVGGRNYRLSPFNRALLGRRQIGSTVKPFIYLQAFSLYKPWGLVMDEPFTWSYEGQKWAPKNYDGKFRGEVPLYEALAQSLNIPAVKLSKEVGLESIRDTLYASGFSRNVELLPSMALGTVEMTPLELAQSYSTLANLGRFKKLSSILDIRSLDGELLYQNSLGSYEEKLDALKTSALVSVLKLSQKIGTSRGLQSFGVSPYVAGKTGTTNDLKDSWFVGFDPQTLTVVWVGYDNNDTTGLTGASGALPIWGSIYQNSFKEGEFGGDFKWPEGAVIRDMGGFELVEP